ncbi:thermonuclease family protein [Conchiformibius steedae DSM 2580]|uniref:Thermonuclease family protein n=1 Tax=Conchiformibius steedae DSM 2580 TaxID=1121352 RepID=A0AAE9HXE6_9NEIS|nr:thermonuclease family protein [Conchiformibius steedae]QMT34053.1 thermonuclease family protein [Conchiformibius steedae]URD66826.1 thermonuclease family protein [Conchiformibius steedae DSM 2580]
MFYRKLYTLFAAVLLAGACAPVHLPPAAPDTTPNIRTPAADKGTHYRATVTAVSDGDTVRVSDNQGRSHKIRLAFIDAPETTQTHGAESREALAKLVQGREVDVEIVDIDRYRRQVARLSSGKRDINYLQIQHGHAWHYQSIAKRNQAKDDFARYAAAEQHARRQHIGLWQHPRPLAPWDYRKNKRQKHQLEH